MNSIIYRLNLQDYLQRPIKDDKSARECWDMVHLVSVLQGLVNRDTPRLYLRAIQPVDDFWWDWMCADWLKSREVIDLTTIDELLDQFQSFYNGAVIYDPLVFATSNVASTIAGIEKLLPVRYDTDQDSLFMQLIDSGRLKAVRWLLN